MHGQGSYGPPGPPPQFRQRPPPQFQQVLPPPPPPPSHNFQQGPPIQAGGLPPPPPPFMYHQHQHNPNVMTSYMHAPRAPSGYQVTQQNSAQYNAPSGTSVQEMMRFQMPPRALPPPPPPPQQGQHVVYANQIHGQTPLPLQRPAPPNSSFFSTPYATFSHSTHLENVQPPSVPAPPPPPPPSSPPPLPPSPPPLNSYDNTENLLASPEKRDISAGIVVDSGSDYKPTGVGETKFGDYPNMETRIYREGQVPSFFHLPPPLTAAVEEVERTNVMCDSSRSPLDNKLSSVKVDAPITLSADLDSGSDMETEGGNNLSGKDQGVDISLEGLENSEFMHNEPLDVREQLHTGGAFSGVMSYSTASAMNNNDKEPNGSTSGRPFDKNNHAIIDFGEASLNDRIQKSTTPHSEDSTTPMDIPASSSCYKEVEAPDLNVASPFRLVQGYDSEDGPSNEDVSPSKTSQVEALDNQETQEDMGSNLVTVSNTEHVKSSLNGSDIPRTSLPSNIKFSSSEVLDAVEETIVSSQSVAVAETDFLVNDIHEPSPALCYSHDTLQGKADTRSVIEKFHKEISKQNSTVKEVDEYGRLTRGESDSEGNRHTKRHARSGRSRSRSPYDRWRRRSRSPRRKSRSPRRRSRSPKKRSRSPRRRKEKRSRSRSWSPKKRFSRSRTPPTPRKMGEFSREKVRRDRDQASQCFDFLRGNCQRGGSCRYAHRNSASRDVPWRYNSKEEHYSEGPKDSRSAYSSNPSERKKSSYVLEGNSVNKDDMYFNEDVRRPESGFAAGEDARCITSIKVVEELPTTSATFEIGQDADCDQLEKQQTAEQGGHYFVLPENRISEGALTKRLPNQSDTGGTCLGEPFSGDILQEPQTDTVITQQPEARISALEDLRIFPSIDSQMSPKQLGAGRESFPGTISSIQEPYQNQNYSSTTSLDQTMAATHQSLRPENIATRPLPSITTKLHNHSPIQVLQYSRPENIQSQPIPLVMHPAYQAQLSNQHFQTQHQSRSSLVSLPPPPLYESNPIFVNQASGFRPQHNSISLRDSQLTKLHPHQERPQSQAAGFHHHNYPSEDLHRHHLHMEEVRPRALPMDAMHGQQTGSATYSELTCVYPLKPEVGQFHPWPQQDSKSFSGFGNPSGSLQYIQQQQPLIPQNLDPSTSRFTSSMHNSDFQTPYSGIGVSELSSSTHYNPFASTFERHGSFAANHSLSGEQTSGVLGTRPMAASADSNKSGGNIMPWSGGLLQATHSNEPYGEGFPPIQSQFVQRSTGSDQYDPILDNIEPTSNIFRLQNHGDGQDLSAIASIPHGLLDMGQNNKLKEYPDTASVSSPENDDFDETAIDAEVGAVENGSPDNDNGNTGMDNNEIGGVQVKEKSKKSKDSKSTKPFKLALADFVKEVLKPSWKQGNLSKEAFKTIVKKTVDKVSGAMKSHQVPKSQAKINQYVESSQRKLTKLVMGYVDKYVKV